MSLTLDPIYFTGSKTSNTVSAGLFLELTINSELELLVTYLRLQWKLLSSVQKPMTVFVLITLHSTNNYS